MFVFSIPLFCVMSKHCINNASSIQCSNACLPDFCNLCNFVNAGWKRIMLDRLRKPSRIGMKSTSFSALMDG